MNSIDFCRDIKGLVAEMTHRAKSSHIGSCYSIADILSVLYCEILDREKIISRSISRDRLIFSKGHAAAIAYACLHKIGIISYDEILSYGLNGSNMMAHVSHLVKGVEFSTGSLGHGLPFAVGKSLYAKKNNQAHKIYVILSDGELDEGSNWEAIMFASHHHLSNLCIIVDYNKLQSLTTIEKTLSLEPLAKKFDSFGCEVVEIDGHDHESIYAALKNLGKTNKPLVVMAHTVKGNGISFMENKVEWHYKSPNLDELILIRKELGL